MEKSITISNRKTKVMYKNSYENYLEFPFRSRNSLIKLGISSHSLRIETDLPSLAISECKCFSCDDSIEEELRLLFDCECYHNLEKHKDMYHILSI